jgi:sulfate transport system permease protein
MGLFLFMPLCVVFGTALSKGLAVYMQSIKDADTIKAIQLTVLTAFVAVPINLVFGIAASWAIAKFDFHGKNFLLTLIDLPLSVSPVISGLIFILLFGAQGTFGPWLRDHGVKIIFAPPAIILATIFVTFPMVARELIPIMKSQGNDEEEAAITLGASGFKTFWYVTLPNIKWGLLYGVILSNARAMGDSALFRWFPVTSAD